MSGPHVVRPTVLQACEAWQVEAGNANLSAACRWANGYGLWEEGAPIQCVWLHGEIRANVGDWIVRLPGGPQIVLSAEEFAAAWEVVPTETTGG